MRYLVEDKKKYGNMQFIKKWFLFDKVIDNSLPLPADASSIIVNGVLRGSEKRILEAQTRKIPWIYFDNGYFGKSYRVSICQTAPTKILPSTYSEIKNFTFMPWVGGTGESILVLPPSIPYIHAFGLGYFLNEVIYKLSQISGREIIVRTKSLPGYPEKENDIKEQIDNCRIMVTWGSAVSLEALERGKPTISLGWCPGRPLSFGMQDIETRALEKEPDRHKLFNSLTYASFSECDLEKGTDIYEKYLRNAFSEYMNLKGPVFKHLKG